MWPFTRPKLRILILCTANVCRSPAAEAFLRFRLAQQSLQKIVRVDSAGTHVGAPGRLPDPRVRRIAEQNGVPWPKIRAKQVTDRLLQKADRVWVMENAHLDFLAEHHAEFAPRVELLDTADQDVPDPYFGSFENVREVLEHLDSQCLKRVDELRDLLLEDLP